MMSRQDSETHVRLVAWLHIILSVSGASCGGVCSASLSWVSGCYWLVADESEAMGILAVIGTFIAVFLFLVSVPGLVGGIGLLKRQNWARILVLILSVLQLFNIPFGTAVGIYSLWVLTREETMALLGETRGWKE